MKIVAFIMAFLVLALSIMPCADTAAHDSNIRIELNKSTPQTDNPHNDDCSPFCHCTCCASISIDHFVVSATHISCLQCKAVQAYLPADVIEIALPIWQPPQSV
jgi:hypothetical protein